MTDLGLSAGATNTCPNCGAQNPAGSLRCRACGAAIPTERAEADRGDLEVEEVARALVAEGYDGRFEPAGDGVRCGTCGNVFGGAAAAASMTERRVARDTPTARAEVSVVALVCPVCGARGTIVDADWVDALLPDAGTEEEIDSWSRRRDAGAEPRRATPEHPLGADEEHLVALDDGDTRSLRERGSLIDEQGDDIREYTGEPVETEAGTVLPQQQNVGPGNEAGGGEWPDPKTPSAQPEH